MRPVACTMRQPRRAAPVVVSATMSEVETAGTEAPRDGRAGSGWRAFLVGFALAAADALAVAFWPRPTEVDVGLAAREARVAALPAATDADVAAMEGLLVHTGFGGPGSAETRRAGVDQVLSRLGDRAGPALARALVRKDASLDRGMTRTGYPRDDAEYHIVA